jgi:aldose 1-epimerase
VNNGHNALHGGSIGFDQLVWQDHPRSDGVDFTLVSKNGDMGFPGELHVTVSYRLRQRKLTIKYLASTDQTTVINLTNHTYFNLNGDDQGNILDHLVYLNADRYTPVCQDLIPTGTEDEVAGTPLDFRHATAVDARIGQPYEQLKVAGGYDHNFVLNGEHNRLRIAASVHVSASGRKLSVWTTEPGIQFYSGNFLDGSFTGRHAVRYERNAGLCLETQHFPDSPNHSGFPSTVLSPGHPFSSTTIWEFGVTDADTETAE